MGRILCVGLRTSLSLDTCGTCGWTPRPRAAPPSTIVAHKKLLSIYVRLSCSIETITALVAQWLFDPHSEQQVPGSIPIGHTFFVPFVASSWPALHHLMPVYYKSQDRVITPDSQITSPLALQHFLGSRRGLDSDIALF